MNAKGKSQLEAGGVMEPQEEYMDLQRKYKNIENDRKTYNEETQAQLKKQKNMIDKLQKENQSLKEDLDSQNNHLAKNKTTQQS